MSSSNSPCAACKFLRRKCTQECVFAPYFPPDQPNKFINVHKVFGASNVAKILNELNAAQREDAVNSLAYEAEARLRDPVYGCVGLISILQHRVKQAQSDLELAKKELATIIGPQAMLPMLSSPGFVLPPQHMGAPSHSAVMQQNMMPMMGIPMGSASHGNHQLMIREPMAQHQAQQVFEAQQFAAVAREQQEMLRSYDHQQQQEIVRFSGFEGSGNSVTATGLNQITSGGGGSNSMSSSLGLGTFENHHPYAQVQQQQEQNQHGHNTHTHQLLLQSQQQQPQQSHQRSGSDEGRSTGPSL